MKKKPFADDGRVIAPMNVAGMPGYRETPMPYKGGAAGLDRRQFRFAMMGALGAGLTVAGVISAGIILFVLFCTNVWLR